MATSRELDFRSASPKRGEVSSPLAGIAFAALREVLGDPADGNYAVKLWDGTRLGNETRARFTLKVNDPGALRLAFTPPLDLNGGRAFAAGLLDCDGDLEAAFDHLYSRTHSLSTAAALRVQPLLLRLPKSDLPVLREAHFHGALHSRERDRAAIKFHYDQPVEFYRTFLGTLMVYSCAYFDEGVTTLEEAQRAKMDHVLRKLRVKEGDRLLDIGCGWGALVVHVARVYGARALGVTLSQRQYVHAQREIEAAGLGHLASVELRDYRDLGAERFDKIASIGMVEHVGRSHLPEYFAKAFALLRPGGLFLNHGIADQSPGRRNGEITGFIARFAFPDGDLVPIADSLQIAERSGFEVRDVESLREHYALTLRAWVRNLERNRADAVAAAGEQAYRIWRLYMAGSAQGFQTGRINVFQTLLSKPDAGGRAEVPRTRRDLYRERLTPKAPSP
jgi:cyclopropane-fatty-acyl-phospholipid synthase